MTDLLELGTVASSPLTQRVVESRYASLEDAERDSIQAYHGGCSKGKSAGAMVGLIMLFMMGYSQLQVHENPTGVALMLLSAAGIAYVVYEFRRKPRVFILQDSFAIERRFSSEVELVQWTDVTKLYCIDRTTRIRSYVLFIPVASSEHHYGRIRIVLVDGRQLVISNRSRNFSDMANQIRVRTTAAQLMPYAQFVVEEGRTLDFDKFGLSNNGLVCKGKVIDWSEIQRVTLSQRGVLSFRTGKWLRSPRFNLEAIPNASLLLELLAILGVQCVNESSN